MTDVAERRRKLIQRQCKEEIPGLAVALSILGKTRDIEVARAGIRLALERRKRALKKAGEVTMAK